MSASLAELNRRPEQGWGMIVEETGGRAVLRRRLNLEGKLAGLPRPLLICGPTMSVIHKPTAAQHSACVSAWELMNGAPLCDLETKSRPWLHFATLCWTLRRRIQISEEQKWGAGTPLKSFFDKN